MQTLISVCLSLSLIWVATMSYAECIEYKIIDHGDSVEAICIGESSDEAKKREIENNRIQEQKTAQEHELQRRKTKNNESNNAYKALPSSAHSTTGVKSGEKVTLIKAMSDGVTYYVRTPSGTEIWKDRDLYNFAGNQEECTVLKSYGNEVLLNVPIMNAKYWFTVIKTKFSP